MQPKFIMHLDCFDNFLAMPPERILEQMAEFDTDLLISGEENCWPDPTQACTPTFSSLHHQNTASRNLEQPLTCRYGQARTKKRGFI